MTGYLNPNYAKSLSEFGQPRYLPRCGGWILERQIPGSLDRDGMGCYPLFCCKDWSQLAIDLEEISQDLVSISLVADPFGNYEIKDLERCFPDVCFDFKDSFIIDFSKSWRDSISKKRQKKSRQALKNIIIENCESPIDFIDEWTSLYQNLAEKHQISGINSFSKKAFVKQLSLPGTVLLRAIYENITVGATLWYIQGDVVYGHLAAFSDLGYKLKISYALDWFALEYFSTQVHWLYFGGGAGVNSDGTDGLSDYKRGWCNQTRPLYFCGRIFDQMKYEKLVQSKEILPTKYFPAYRKGEFG